METSKQKNSMDTCAKDAIKGISCDVKNCAYHSGDHMCCAGNIYVGPCEADCSANTSCVTFKPREY